MLSGRRKPRELILALLFLLWLTTPAQLRNGAGGERLPWDWWAVSLIQDVGQGAALWSPPKPRS